MSDTSGPDWKGIAGKLAEAVQQAADKFQQYALMHAEKGNIEKGLKNAQMELVCTTALEEYRAALASASDWILVKERLPGPFEKVLVISSEPTVAWLDRSGDWCAIQEPLGVIKWLPIPKEAQL